MVISMEHYATLRRDFLKVAKFHIKPAALEDLKLDYKDVINSVRTSNGIENIEELIRILEKRGVIRYDKIIPLKHIARHYLRHSVINDKLDEYEQRLKNYAPQYPPQTNLYRLGNGEFYSENTNINCLSFHQNSYRNNNYSSSKDRFSCGTSVGVIIDDDYSNCNNSSSTEISLTNNVNSNNRYNSPDKTPKHSMVRVVPHKNYNFAQNVEGSVVSEVPVPFGLISESEGAVRPSASLHSSNEDLSRTERIANTPLLSTPQSAKPQTVCSSKFDVTLSSSCQFNSSNSKGHVTTKTNRFEKILPKRYWGILFIVLTLAAVVSIIIILYDSWKNSVYKPEPTAPSLPATLFRPPGTSSHPDFEHGAPWNQNTDPFLMTTSPPLQTLSEKEKKIQELVFRRVSRDLGKSWRDVARRLGVRESKINEIETQYSDLEKKGYAALRIFAADSDFNYWQKNLKKGLELGRRKDLAEVVEELVSRKYSD